MFCSRLYYNDIMTTPHDYECGNKSYFYLHGAHNVLLMINILDCMCHISLLMFLVTFLQLKETELSSCSSNACHRQIIPMLQSNLGYPATLGPAPIRI